MNDVDENNVTIFITSTSHDEGMFTSESGRQLSKTLMVFLFNFATIAIACG